MVIFINYHSVGVETLESFIAIFLFVETRTYCIYKVYSGSIRYYWQSNPAIEGLKKGAGSRFNSVDIDKFSFSMCASA